MSPDQALQWAELAVAVVGLGGFAHSAYRGTISRAMTAVRIVPEIKDRVESVDEKVDNNTDAIIALVEAHDREDVSPDRGSIVGELRPEEDEGRFLRDGGSREEDHRQ